MTWKMHAGWYQYSMFQLLNYACLRSRRSVQKSCSNGRAPIAQEHRKTCCNAHWSSKRKSRFTSDCGNTTIHQTALGKISSLDLPGAFRKNTGTCHFWDKNKIFSIHDRVKQIKQIHCFMPFYLLLLFLGLSNRSVDVSLFISDSFWKEVLKSNQIHLRPMNNQQQELLCQKLGSMVG